jgi:hypothetical protein
MEITTRHKTIEKISRKRGSVLLDEPKKHQLSAAGLIEEYPLLFSSSVETKNKKKKSLSLKRISPFFILGFFLVGLFPYMFLTGSGTIHNPFLLLFAFLFFEINVLYADFALWNYFEGKKIFRIWLIEVPLALLIVYFLI